MDGVTEVQKNNDLIFFGQVNASISHELINILAIISETTGLLNDLMKMSAGGKEVAPESIMSCGNDIIGEIQRGFATINQMNRFSHSVDKAIDRIDLIKLIELIMALTGFLSFACRLRLQKPSENDSTLQTCPFRLQKLIYKTVVYAFKATGPEGEVLITVNRETDNSARIAFSGIGSLISDPFPSENVNKLAASIGAEVRMKGKGAIEIMAPELDAPGE